MNIMFSGIKWSWNDNDIAYRNYFWNNISPNKKVVIVTGLTAITINKRCIYESDNPIIIITKGQTTTLAFIFLDYEQSKKNVLTLLEDHRVMKKKWGTQCALQPVQVSFLCHTKVLLGTLKVTLSVKQMKYHLVANTQSLLSDPL